MELLSQYYGLFIILAFVITLLVYRKITNNKEAAISKFVISKNVTAEVNLKSKIISALESSGFQTITYHEKENRITANTSVSFKSWGEIVEIQLEENKSNPQIVFKSICAFPFQIYDWGKNKRNFNKFWKNFNLK
ncbi:hypothetical protein H1R17_01170 [Flavobacterium sp. xlx-214]|uniref:hypothetical protein n=1 Tax=unclassified Flavobacterium TaxID=196869 RepID=UPI0013D88E3A|nr:MULTISPECIES: hypothetical protein [unclassified Flavobacterium]MBA5792630.1 hypothetical protein [Flavobacterium sp. xlx-221]QMI83779.1 hypothetical protein H1R17_01170 [Flavobacterium sp. xlx-214]